MSDIKEAVLEGQEVSEEPVKIVSRDDIPVITEVECDDKLKTLGEMRDFRWHETLKKFLPSEDIVSFSWVKLSPGEILQSHKHSIGSMIIVCQGKGEFIVGEPVSLQEGDIVTVPAGRLHAFKGLGPDGFRALSIQFGAGIYTDPKNPRVTFSEGASSLESLVRLNNENIERFKQCRFLEMLADGTLKNPMKRQRYVDALQIWSNKNQDLLFVRQATTLDETYSSMFLEHLFEEVGHDRMHADRQEKFEPSSALEEDPIIEAIADWFICRMFREDNIAKTALIHLIIENASNIYHIQARPILASTINDTYFKEHEADTRHAEMGMNLLRHLSSEQYKYLHQVINKGWKMLLCMTERVCFLVDQVN